MWHSKKKVSGVLIYIAVRRMLKGFVIVIATEKPGSMIDDYDKRWSIEILFGNLKSRGYHLESTHMTNLDWMDKLMRIVIEENWCYGNAN